MQNAPLLVLVTSEVIIQKNLMISVKINIIINTKGPNFTVKCTLNTSLAFYTALIVGDSTSSCYL